MFSHLFFFFFFSETQRKMDEKANGMGDRDQPASTGFGNRLQGFIDKQVNPRRNVMPSMCLYNCNACRYTSLSKQDVLKHMNSHIEVRVLSCEFCLPLFYDESVKTLGVVPFSCGHCLFRTEDLEEMRNHSMVHHKAATCLSELESEEYVSTSQTQQIFNESSGVPKEETVQIADDEVCVDGDRKYNLNKENFCSQQIAGDVTNGAKTGRNYGSSNHALIVEDFQSLSPPAIPRVISQTKANSTIFKAPPGNNGVIPVREFSDNSAAKSKRVVKANRVVAPRKSPRVLRPKLETHLANPEPAYYTPVSEPTYYMPVSEPPSFSVAVLPVNVAPVMPITVTTPLITSTTGGPQNPIPKKQKIHHKKRCPYCGREARDNYCLKVHMLTHSKEKPFACPYENCYYRATQKAHVMKHLQSERHNTSSRRLKNMPSDIS